MNSTHPTPIFYRVEQTALFPAPLDPSFLSKEIMATFKNNFVVGVTAGLVAAVLAPMLFPAIKSLSQ